MSLDIAVWLACSIQLPGDLPSSEKWSHFDAAAIDKSVISAEMMALWKGVESWSYGEPSWQVSVSYLKEAPIEAIARNMPSAIKGISLVFEGGGDKGAELMFGVADVLARKCGGAVLDTPAGIYRLDENGREISDG